MVFSLLTSGAPFSLSSRVPSQELLRDFLSYPHLLQPPRRHHLHATVIHRDATISTLPSPTATISTSSPILILTHPKNMFMLFAQTRPQLLWVADISTTSIQFSLTSLQTLAG
ncbi:uncharacterized protein [Spinacia oleracea]|uniref:Uncharacterized protein isoform X2 n=1 Tax=Spinacia oleracea TaxID=3562 RepID=A0ABM3RKW4_SPIOL|nr:uncharacterized protein LOC130470319 isoform X2 [Spinacia oleracea]